MASENSKNTLYSLLSNLVNIAFPLLIVPMLIDSFGLAGYGYFSTILSNAIILSLLLDLGYTQGMPKYILNHTLSVRESMLLIMVSKLPLFIIFSFFVSLLYSEEKSKYIIYIGMSLTFSLEPIMYGLERYRIILLFQIFSKTIYCALVIAAYKYNRDISLILLSYGFSYIVINFLYLFNLWPNIFFGERGRRLCKETYLFIIRDCLKFHFSKLFVNIYQQSSVFFVSIFNADNATGIYALANQLYKVAQSTIGSIVKVSYTNMLKEKKIENLINMFKYTLYFYFFGLSIVVFGGKDILSAFFDSGDKLYFPCLIFYFSLFFVILSSFFGYPYLTPIGKEKHSHLGLVISSLTYFLLFSMAFFINTTDIVTFALLIFCADLSGAVYRTYYSIKYRRYYEFGNLK